MATSDAVVTITFRLRRPPTPAEQLAAARVDLDALVLAAGRVVELYDAALPGAEDLELAGALDDLAELLDAL